MKFTKENAFKFKWPGLKGWAYNSKEDFANASAVYFEISGSHGRVKTTHSDRIYLVLEGEGEFDIDGKTTKVNQQDVIIIPKNTPYDYKAISKVLKLYLVHSPAYEESAEVKLE